MKKLLNTLYVTRQDVYLRQEGEAVVVEKDGSVILRLPIHTLSGVVTFGRVMVSPYLMNLCAERGVCLSMLTEHGKFLARVEGPVSGNVLLRMAQLRVHDQAERKCDLARSFLIGKVVNTRSVLMRRVRDHGETPNLAAAIERQTVTLAALREGGGSVASLRGLEGEAAAAYFAAFNDLIVAQRERFSISSRNRRPPTDPTNSLLSYAYTLLAHECRGALESVGLDPQVGFLHEVRSGRPALALDLMEEFRSVIADRAVLSLINLKQVGPRDFKTSESGAITLSDEARKTFLAVWQKRKQEVVTHPFLNEKIAIGLLPYAQALLLVRHLRGDLDAYPPYMIVK